MLKEGTVTVLINVSYCGAVFNCKDSTHSLDLNNYIRDPVCMSPSEVLCLDPELRL